jgi:hypothetical protein
MQDSWPKWLYGPNGEAAIFDGPDDAPEGWIETPDPHPLDHDGDGKKGGSRKRK